MHKKDFRTIDPLALVPLWNKFYPSRYAIDEDLFKLNTVDSPLFDWGASVVAYENSHPVAFVVIKRSASRLYRGPDPDTLHINSLAFVDPEFAIDLLADVKKILRNRGAHQLVFGQDSRHFFPGCPTDAVALRNFLMVEGFQETGCAYDLERDLTDYYNPARETDKAIYRVLVEDDRKSLLTFFEKQFPGRWRHDVLDKVAMEGLSHCVFGLIIEGQVQGFALIQNQEQRRPIGGAVWRNDLGENWGSLGPIGIAKEIRGQGFGNRLLGEALDYLKKLGVRRCIIDWTTLREYYEKHGFQVTRSYQSMSLPLERL